MPRTIRIAAAQVGAVHRDDDRSTTINRLIRLLHEAADEGAQVVLFPECTFTTFFPRYLLTDKTELESFFEHSDVTTAKDTKGIFDAAYSA
jgi:predicted amidohydrolase